MSENRLKSSYENPYDDNFNNNEYTLNKNYSQNYQSWKGYRNVEKSFSENNINGYHHQRTREKKEISIYDNNSTYSNHGNKMYNKNNEYKKKGNHLNYDNYQRNRYHNYNPSPSYYDKNHKNDYTYYKEGSNVYSNEKYSKTKKLNNLYSYNQGIGDSLTKEKLSQMTLSELLQKSYDGMCNFIIFAKSCSVYILKSETHLIDDIKVSNYFKNFEPVSAYGLDVSYIIDGKYVI